jgi:hypothetical protein
VIIRRRRTRNFTIVEKVFYDERQRGGMRPAPERSVFRGCRARINAASALRPKGALSQICNCL